MASNRNPRAGGAGASGSFVPSKNAPEFTTRPIELQAPTAVDLNRRKFLQRHFPALSSTVAALVAFLAFGEVTR
jgi:hypothetical protein